MTGRHYATEPGERYWLRLHGDPDWTEITADEYRRREREAGFHPTGTNDPAVFATAAFAAGRVEGRVAMQKPAP